MTLTGLHPANIKSRGRWAALCVVVGCWLVAGCATSLVDKLYQARNGDPDDMREAITGIGEVLYAMEQEGVDYDEAGLEAVRYLIEVVTSKAANPLNRSQALSALGRLQRPDVSDLFTDSLADRFWLVRLEAAKAIIRHPNPEAAPIVIEQLLQEPRVEVRIELVRNLLEFGPDESLETLLRLHLDQTGRYDAMRLKIYSGLLKFSGEDFPLEDELSWKNYYDALVAESESSSSAAPPKERSQE